MAKSKPIGLGGFSEYAREAIRVARSEARARRGAADEAAAEAQKKESALAGLAATLDKNDPVLKSAHEGALAARETSNAAAKAAAEAEAKAAALEANPPAPPQPPSELTDKLAAARKKLAELPDPFEPQRQAQDAYHAYVGSLERRKRDEELKLQELDNARQVGRAETDRLRDAKLALENEIRDMEEQCEMIRRGKKRVA